MSTSPKICARRISRTEAGSREEVFRGAEDHIGDPGVPMDAHGVACARDARRNARFLGELAEFHVVDDFHGQTPVRAHFFVRAAPNELKSADAGVDAGARIAAPARDECREESEREKAHGDSFSRIEHFSVARAG